MPKHDVGTQEEWSAARQELLEREQKLGALDEEVAKQRQALPWVPVEKEYAFDTEEGKKTLAELFDGRSQLGWKFPWVSSFGSDFNFDFDFAFASEHGVVYQTYARTALGRFLLAPYYYQLLDQIPNGRDGRLPATPPRRVLGITKSTVSDTCRGVVTPHRKRDWGQWVTL